MDICWAVYFQEVVVIMVCMWCELGEIAVWLDYVLIRFDQSQVRNENKAS